MKTRALIFDVDGTLVDTEELHRNAFNQVFVDFSLAWEWTPELYADLLHYSGGVDRLFAYVQRSGLTASEKAYLTEIVPMLHREKTQIYTDLVHGTAVRARPGAARLIVEALGSDVKVALVATSAFADVRGLARATLGEKIASAIDPIVCTDHVAHKKPAPDLYQLAVNHAPRSGGGLRGVRRFSERACRCQAGVALHDRDADPLDSLSGFPGCRPDAVDAR